MSKNNSDDRKKHWVLASQIIREKKGDLVRVELPLYPGSLAGVEVEAIYEYDRDAGSEYAAYYKFVGIRVWPEGV